MALLERFSSGLVAPAAVEAAAAAAAAEALAALAATAAATAPAWVPGGSRYPERVIQSITLAGFGAFVMTAFRVESRGISQFHFPNESNSVIPAILSLL